MRTIQCLLAASVVLGWVGTAYSQCQVQKLVASDGEHGDNFGLSVAIDGDIAVMGAPYEGDIEPNSGAIYIFQRSGTTWTEVRKFKASDAAGNPYGLLGCCVAVSGNVIVAGAEDDTGQGPYGSGAVYVFELVGGVWSETAKLKASDMTPVAYFGSSISLEGDRMLVGARNATPGAAYVFDRVGGSWVESAKLMAGGPDFGSSVDLDADQAIVGAPGQGSGAGVVHIFEKTASGWVRVQYIIASDQTSGDEFGCSVGIEGSRAVVGAPGHSHGVQYAGSAYVFDRMGSTWTETRELLASDQTHDKYFGVDVELSGDHILIGAEGDEESVSSTRGSAYDFRWNGSAWIQAGKMLARDAGAGDLLGVSVARSGDLVLVGAFGADACTNDPGCSSGAAYIFELGSTATQYGSCPTGSPCNNWDKHGGCGNSSFHNGAAFHQGAVFAACGSGSVTTDDLRLEVTRCPPNKLTLLFMGPGQQSAIYGDGIRVVSAQNPVGIYRFGGATTDSIGRLMRGPGLVAQSQTFQPLGRIQSGQTWNFQFWYRDLAGPCHHLTNFSNGVQVAFGP